MPRAATQTEPRRLVVFDFDGTLTTEDTFVGFMKFYHGTPKWYAIMVPLLPVFLRYKLGRIDRHAVKHAVVAKVFTGEPMARIESRAADYARDVIPSLIRPEGLARFQRRIAESRRGRPEVVVCSASISPYLRAFFAPLGAPDIVACELESDAKGMCTGRLAGFNVWGENKMKALEERFHSDSIHLVESYGDSAGDGAILGAADTAFWRPFRL